MKIKILLITSMAIAFISCNETNFGNNIMKDIGSGKYVEASSGVYSAEILDLLNTAKTMDILLNKDVFSLAEVNDMEAKQKSKIEDFEKYFNIDVMFDNFNLVESQHSSVDLLILSTITTSDRADKNLMEAIRLGRESSRSTDRNYVSLSESSFITTAYANVDKYKMKYKITINQTDKIAYLTVIKIPEKGYRVTSFLVF